MSRKFQCKTIPSTWLENNGRRLDCGPYMSGAVEAKELLKKHSTVPLQDLTAGHNGGIFNGPRFPRVYVQDPEHGVPFLGSTDTPTVSPLLTPIASHNTLLLQSLLANTPF
jgi:type I restriction enzyme, S subunit